MTSETPSPEASTDEPTRRRPGCLRRWLVRPVVWLLALLLVLLAAAALYLQSDSFEERIHALVEERASRALGRQVTVGELELQLVGLVATARQVRVAGAEAGEAPFFTANQVAVNLSVLNLVWSAPTRAQLRLDQVSVEEPVLRLQWNSQGESNLPQFDFGGDSEGDGFEVRLGRLLVERGELLYGDQRVPLSFDAHRVLGTLDGEDSGDGGAFDFRLSAAALSSLRVPAAERTFAPAASFEGRLWGDRLEIQRGAFRGSADAPPLDVQMSGRIDWGETPEVDLAVDGTLDATWANRLGFMERPISGPLAVSRGRVLWSSEDWRWGGRLASDRLEFFDRVFRQVEGEVAGDAAKVRMDVDHAHFVDGDLSGSWSLDLARGEGADWPQQARIEIRGMNLARLLDEIGLPIEGLTGRLAGEMTYRFDAEEPLGGSGSGRVRVEPLRGASGNLRTVRGEIPLTVERGQLVVTGARLSNPATTASVEALYDLQLGTGVVRYLLVTDDLPRSLGAVDPTWMEPGLEVGPLGRLRAGRGTVGGTLDVAPGELFGRIEVELRELATEGLTVDRLEGSFEHDFLRQPGSPDDLLGNVLRLADLSLRAEKGVGELAVTGTLDVPRDDPGAAAYDLQVALAEWPVTTVLPLLPMDLRAEGGLTGLFEVAGTGAVPQVRGTVRSAPLEVAGVEIRRAAAELGYRDQALRLEQLTMELPAGLVEAVGTVDFVEGELLLSAEAAALNVARIQQLTELPGDLSGSLALELHLAGPFDDLAGELALRGADLALGERILGRQGEAQLVATWNDGEVEARGSLLGLLRFDGGGLLSTEAVDLALDVETDRLAELVSLVMPEAPSLEGSLKGRLTVTSDPSAVDGGEDGAGDHDGFGAWSTRLELARLALTWEDRRITNLEPVVLALRQGVLELQSVFLGNEETASELFVGGQVDLTTPEPRLDLRLQSSLAADWLELLVTGSDVEVEGTFDMLATVRGTPAAPRINGQGELRRGQVLLRGFPHSLEGVNAIVLFDPGVVLLDSFQGRFAGGDVKAAGRVRLPRQDQSADYTLQAQGQGLTLRYPEGWTLRGGATLTLRSLPGAGGREIQGAVTLDRAIYVRDVPVGLFQVIQGALQRQRLALRETDELLASTQLSLSVEGPDALRVRNNVADLRGDVSLSVQGTLARPVVFGQVEVASGGELLFRDNRYTVERGLLTFANPYRVDPVIDLVATTEVRRFDIQLALSGTLDRLNASFTSNPPLADLEVLGLITTGVGPNDRQVESGVAERFLFGQAASALSKRVNTLFGFDKFQIDPGTGGDELLSGIGFSVEKRLARDVVVIFARDPTSTERELLQVEWEISAGFTLILSREADGSFALDGRWERTF